MPLFQYTVLTPDGRRKSGTQTADSAAELRRSLRQQNYTPLSVTPAIVKKQGWFSRWRNHRQKLTKTQLALLTRQLATLLEAGMPLAEALICVAEQQQKPSADSLLRSIHQKITEGCSLADAMLAYPDAFPVIYRTTIAAAEKSGKLNQVLSSLADYTEKQEKIKKQIQQALIYPSLVSTVSFLVILFLLLHVVPTIIQVFVDNQQSLPIATRILLAITHFLQQDGWLLALIVTLLIWSTRKILAIPRYRFHFDTLLLRLPIIGKTMANINSARFARSLGILQSATVPILDALTAANALVKPLPMQQAIAKTIIQVREGKGIADSLAVCHHFPRMLIHLIQSGEQSGRLADMLHKAAETQENNTEMVIKSSLALFEPLMIILMGGVVLFIVLAVMLPIFSLNQLAGQI